MNPILLVLCALLCTACTLSPSQELESGAQMNLKFLQTEHLCLAAGGGPACLLGDERLGLRPPNSVQHTEGEHWYACARSAAMSTKGECACMGPGLEPAVVDCAVFDAALASPESLPRLLKQQVD